MLLTKHSAGGTVHGGDDRGWQQCRERGGGFRPRQSKGLGMPMAHAARPVGGGTLLAPGSSIAHTGFYVSACYHYC